MEKAPGWDGVRGCLGGEPCLSAVPGLCMVEKSGRVTFDREQKGSDLEPRILCGSLTFPQPGFHPPSG